MVSNVTVNDSREGAVTSSDKVFVKNLSNSTTDEISPLKKCYVVKGQDGLCLGYGYAQFVFEEDAKNVIEKLNKSVLNNQIVHIEYYKRKEKSLGISFRGKSEKGQRADFKNKSEKDRYLDSKDVRNKAPKTNVNKYGAIASKKTKPKLLRKAVVRKLQDKRSSKSILIPSGESAQMRINVRRFSVSNRTLVLSNLPKCLTFDRILQEVEKMNGFQALEFPLKDDPHAAYVLFSSVNKAALGLIEIRNADSLFNCSRQEIGARLYSVVHIKQYTVIVRNLPYECTKKQLTETFERFGRIFEVSLPLDPSTERNRGFGFVTFLDAFGVDKAIEGSAQLHILNRKVEVSRTVKHQKLKEIQADRRSDKNSSEDNESGESAEEDSVPNGLDDSDNERDSVNVGSSTAEDKSAEQSRVLSGNPGTVRKKKPFDKGFFGDASLGKTLFLRNIALDTTEEEVLQRFSNWGPIVYVKFVKDRETGDFAGTGFVQFVHAKDSQKCIEDAYLSYKFIEEGPTIRKKLQMHGVDTWKESDIVVRDRHLVIDMAVNREDTYKFKKKSNIQDSRNLSLAKCSVLSSEEIKQLTKAELLKYEHSQHEKKKKLSNPNFHVSKTRLCVRNLPKSLDEKKLKLIFKNAATLPTLPLPRFHQVKIVRNKLEGNKSRGYGFVEFTNHAHARAAMLALHNKICAYANNNRLFVEFAIEDMRVLFRRKLRLAIKQNESKKSADSNDSSSDASEAKALEKKGSRLSSKKRKKIGTKETNKDEFEDTSAKRAKRANRNFSSLMPSKNIPSKSHILSNKATNFIKNLKKRTRQAMQSLAKRQFANQTKKRNTKKL